MIKLKKRSNTVEEEKDYLIIKPPFGKKNFRLISTFRMNPIKLCQVKKNNLFLLAWQRLIGFIRNVHIKRKFFLPSRVFLWDNHSRRRIVCLIKKKLRYLFHYLLNSNYGWLSCEKVTQTICSIASFMIFHCWIWNKKGVARHRATEVQRENAFTKRKKEHDTMIIIWEITTEKKKKSYKKKSNESLL